MLRCYTCCIPRHLNATKVTVSNGNCKPGPNSSLRFCDWPSHAAFKMQARPYTAGPFVFVLFLFSFPGLYWMYPTITDRLESYQPLQALKFFATHGQAFHKYGPFPNFVLAPFYGVTLAVWHFMGTLKPPLQHLPIRLCKPACANESAHRRGQKPFSWSCVFILRFCWSNGWLVYPVPGS